MKVAVVGGGWAGMAAADTLVQAAHDVTVYEVSHQLGGRARGLDDPALGSIDNGQHLMIGAYQNTLALVRRAWQTQAASDATLNRQVMQRMPLGLHRADGSMHLQTFGSVLPTLLRSISLLTAHGLSLKDRIEAVWLLGRIKLGLAHPAGNTSVTQWLDQNGQSDSVSHKLWIPLVLATMNTDARTASAQLFARVLKDSLLSSDPGATDLLIARCDLTSLWIDAVTSKVSVIYGRKISEILPREDGVRIGPDSYDGCILATPPRATSKIVETLAQSAHLVKLLEAFEFCAITTCYVDLEEPLRLPHPMLMLRHGPGQPENAGQWVFDRNAADTQADRPGRLAFVLSHAGAADLDRQSLPGDLLRQLAAELSAAASISKRETPSIPRLRASRVITEKRATFAAIAGLERPKNDTPWPLIKLAGDWTDTGYPAVLEGAVTSGIMAARALMREPWFDQALSK